MKKLCGWAVLLLLPLGAMAQTFGSAVGKGQGVLLDQTSDGNGHYMGTMNDNLTRARVLLYRNGKFDISSQGEGRWRFVGTWKYNNAGNAMLTLTGNVSGKGVLYGNGRGGFRAFDLEGKAKTGRFNISFLAESGNGGGMIGLSASRKGTGSITAPNMSPFTLKQADVNMGRSGTFRIVFHSNRSHIFEGTWGPGRNGQAVLVLTNVPGGGNIALSGRSFSRITLSYVENKRQYTVQFQAR